MTSNNTHPNDDPLARRRVAALALLVVAGVAYVAWMLRSPARQGGASGTNAMSSGLAADGLVGRDRCAQCHADEAADHARSGHARTLARTKDSPIAKSLCGSSVPAADGYDGFTYSCDEEGLMAAVPEKFPDKLFPLDFAFGSGDHAVTFLTLLLAKEAEDGLIGIEHRQTWFRSKAGLGVTPGQQTWVPEREIESFGKAHQGALLRRCITCHTTRFRLVGDQLEDLVVGVQCEACHGPGAEHVAAAEANDAPRIRSTMHTPQTRAEEIEDCGRCHRLPSEIAAERLKRYPPSLTRFQPIGILRSNCYLKSDGRMGCLNCHDAHAHSSARGLEDHVAACRRCHHPEGDPLCAAGHADDCINCHMRKLHLVPGFWVRDHWIRKDPGELAVDVTTDEVTVSGETNEK
jgi:hypothetical protein